MNLTFNELPDAVAALAIEIGEIKRLLLEKSSQTQAEPDNLLTIQQAGAFLNLSVPTLYGYVQQAEIPVAKRGKRLYFSRHDLLQWVKAGSKKTLAETAMEAEKHVRKSKPLR